MKNNPKASLKISGAPLLLEGYGLQDPAGRLSLCISSRLTYDDYEQTSAPAPRPEAIGYNYVYEMFDEGDIEYLRDPDVEKRLGEGSRIVITGI